MRKKKTEPSANEVAITGSVRTGKQSTVAADIIRLHTNDGIPLRDIIAGGLMVVGEVGAGKTKPAKRSQKRP